jgi:hypothetical protein
MLLGMSHSRRQADKSREYEGFDHWAQLQRLFLRSLVRLFMTIILALTTGGILLAYSSPEAISSSQRQQFNALVIGISIGLGINIASSLKSNISQLRWWLLSLRETSPREVLNDLRLCRQPSTANDGNTGRFDSSKRGSW